MDDGKKEACRIVRGFYADIDRKNEELRDAGFGIEERFEFLSAFCDKRAIRMTRFSVMKNGQESEDYWFEMVVGLTRDWDSWEGPIEFRLYRRDGIEGHEECWVPYTCESKACNLPVKEEFTYVGSARSDSHLIQKYEWRLTVVTQ